MSISSMVEPDVRRAVPRAADAADTTPPNQPAAAIKASNVIDQLVTYIPTEIVTIYVAVIAVMHKGQASRDARWIAFWLVLAFSAVVTWLIFATKVRAGGGAIPVSPKLWPHWKMVAAMLAFVAWASALPEGPFWAEAWYDPIYSPIVLLFTTVLLGLLGGLLER